MALLLLPNRVVELFAGVLRSPLTTLVLHPSRAAYVSGVQLSLSSGLTDAALCK